MPNEAPDPARQRVSRGALFRVFLTVGAISFGGGILAYLREYLVRHHRWLSDDEFMDVIEISETLPGLNSLNASVIIGDRLGGGVGAIAAALGLMLPGILFILSLGILWEEHGRNPAISRLLIGVACAGVAILLAVTLQMGSQQLRKLRGLLFIAITFVAVSILRISEPLVILVVGGLAVWTERPRNLAKAVGDGRKNL